MAEANSGQKRREMIAVVRDPADLNAAVADLERHGFGRDDINVLANREVVERCLAPGHATTGGSGSLAAEERVEKVSRERALEPQTMLGSLFTWTGATVAAGGMVATGGALAAILAAAAVGGGAGAAIGAGVATAISKGHTERLRERIARGEVLVCVRAPDAAAEKRAGKALAPHTDEELHAVDMPPPSAAS